MAPVTETGIGLLCLCRQGFEPELAGELQFRAGEAGFAGYARTQRNDGYVLFMCDEAAALAPRLRWRELIFARQKLVVLAELPQLDPADRITPMLEVLADAPRFGDLWVEHPDSDAGKPLSGLARAFGNALRPALRKAGKLTDKPNDRLPRLHVVFVDGTHAFVCVADPADSAPWALGIPRLKLLPEAPSRSALKLDEALLTLLTPEEREALAKPGMRAADLGAAPGGWTWVLTRQHMHVLSIDNGPLRQRAGHRPGRAPARRRLPLAPGTAAGLDGLRHGRAAAPRGRTHGHLVPRRMVQARDLQSEAADEEALGRNPLVFGSVPGAGRQAIGGACQAAVSRP